MKHFAGDGKPARLVYLNGKLLTYVLLADDVRGKVVISRQPIQLDKFKKRILRRTLYGDVKVVFMGQDK